MMKALKLLVATLLIAGCSEKQTAESGSGKPVIYSVNYPLAYFAERLAGDRAEIVFPEMEGDPAFWEPTPEQVAEFQEADLILLNGASYAKWVPKVALPQSKLVDTSAGFSERFIALDGTVTHTHGPGGAHAHGDLAFTTWLDPKLAIHQAEAIHAALSSLGVSSPAEFRKLANDLAALDDKLKDAFAEVGKQPLLGSHPVYQYLERAYGLDMESVHWEPDAEPDADQWRDLEDILEARSARIMLWEDEPLATTKAKLDEKGIASIVFNPSGNRPADSDFMAVMERNSRNLSIPATD